MDFSTVKTNLEARGYNVKTFETGLEAADYIASSLNNKTISFGGSMTVKEIGLYEKLEKNNKLIWHWKPEEGQSPKEALIAAVTSDVYISSVNGMAETGEIINIDGTGNRVASTIFGHEKVILVVGKNKVKKDYAEAYDHAKNVSAPLNAKRLERKTPCAVKGDKCYNCNSPERICHVTAVFDRAPRNGEYEVILINEELGL
ncbi:MAG: lactate utilization protein [Eubacteriales bacterium]|nr:lactate utilization protein [Eubacteriales bacterium]